MSFLSFMTRNIVIRSPKIGFMNLVGRHAEEIFLEDKAALKPLFKSASENMEVPPICDVLLIYCVIDSGGHIGGTNDDLREIIRNSSARIVIIASEGSGDNYIAAAKKKGYGHANLVMILNRKGTAFVTFFKQLFSEMYAGTPMPVAWVKLAPQVPGAIHDNCPESIFSCEVGQIVFKND